MFESRESKELATLLQQHWLAILEAVWVAFDNSIVGCRGEVAFFRSLVNQLSARLDGLRIPGASFNCRHTEIHQKPIVSGSFGSCELGDLLVVVKYHLLDFSVEAKSIIYQVKMSEGGSRKCSIDQKQLTLLREWPPFEFGRRRDGGPQSYDIQPKTIEFGSYMLEPRNAERGEALRYWTPYWWHHFPVVGSYGFCPTALQCYNEGPKKIDLDESRDFLPDVESVLRQILFDRGEHHSNPSVARLIGALYRYIGLDPDPPAEFEGFSEGREEDGFSILEVNIKQGERGSNA